ncbi:MAG: hypothetical protein DMF63_12205 [Acidobacteria bacterium]|nr:MAG: hypothetical protein DMF63_12205 [Acidobacteriota bacterium]
MKRSTLASRLMQAGNKTQRKKLIADNPALADADLARELKDHCYRVWTTEPVAAQKAAASLRSLSEVSRDPEVLALTNWVEGIADITGGKLESAAEHLDTASKKLAKLGREHESAQPLVAKLIALAMLGRYHAAQRTGERALQIFKLHRDQLAAGKIEMNLSNIVSRRDQYKLAEKYCLSAYRRFKKLGEQTWQTMAENGLANTYAELNDFKRAEEFYERALASARRARMSVTVAEIEASMGNLALFRGRYADAIRLIENSRTRYEKLEMPHQSAIADLEIADIYSELNLNAEASDIYRRVIPALSRLKMRAEEARARASFGRTSISAGNFTIARRELKRAAQLYEREQNRTASAAVALRLASVELAARHFNVALKLASESHAVLRESDNSRLEIAAEWLRGEATSRLGHFDEAKQLLNNVLKRATKLEQPATAQATMNSLGVIARETGDSRHAESMFEAAIESVESARAPLPGEEYQMAFLAKSLEPYENLARLYIENGDLENAFLTVERARSRSLLDAVTSRSQSSKNDETTKLREELNWLYSRLARVEGDEVSALQKQIGDREKKLASASLRSHARARTRTQKGTTMTIDALQKQIGERNAVVEFVSDSGTISAFVVTNDRIEYVIKIASETEVLSLLEGLHFQFGALRFGGDQLAVFAEQLKSRADAYLRMLYEKLIEPIARSFGDRDLVVIPSGVLNYVPFHALYDGATYLVKSRDVRYAPSVSVWLSLNSKRSSSPGNSFLMAYADERIPLVNDEVGKLANMLPKARTKVGKNATFAAFQKHAPDADLIHLACHGQFRPDNPMFSSLHLADGWVTVRDLYAIRLKAKLVTLSACETGLSKVHAGEEILGLARGFLSAGARSIVLSLWTVNDEATSRLMQEFYTNLQRGTDVAASLRFAQKTFVDRGEHPYFWSPFFVIG